MAGDDAVPFLSSCSVPEVAYGVQRHSVAGKWIRLGATHVKRHSRAQSQSTTRGIGGLVSLINDGTSCAVRLLRCTWGMSPCHIPAYLTPMKVDVTGV